MRHHLDAMQLAHIGDAADLGQPAAPPDIRLHHGHPAALDPFAHLPARSGRFRPTDPDRARRGQPGMAGEIVVLQGRLGEIDVAVAEAVEHPFGVVPIVPAIAEIDGHQDVVAEHPPALMDEADQLAVAHQVVEQHLHLDGAETGGQRLVELPADLRHQLADRAAMRQPRIDRAIGAELFAAGAAHKLVGGQSELLSREVVERDVDGRDRVDAEPRRPGQKVPS